MNMLAKLRKSFEEDDKGYIYLSQLKKITKSSMLISDIARQYGYYPVYTSKRSNKILAYQHHTLPNDYLLD